MTALPEPPRALVRDTAELMATLERTITNLREFTEKLRAATEVSRQEEL